MRRSLGALGASAQNSSSRGEAEMNVVQPRIKVPVRRVTQARQAYPHATRSESGADRADENALIKLAQVLQKAHSILQ